jgi:hypothetical protein
MVANPPGPVSLLELIAAGSDAPFDLLRTLNVTFSGIQGPAPIPEQPASAPGPSTGSEDTSSDDSSQFVDAPSSDGDAAVDPMESDQEQTPTEEAVPETDEQSMPGTEPDEGDPGGTQFVPKAAADEKKAE